MLLLARYRAATLTTAVAGLVAIAVARIAVGTVGVASAALGAAVVLGFFLMGGLPFVVFGAGGKGKSAMAFLVLGMTYLLRILLGVVVWAAAVESPRIDRVAVGETVIVCALVWVNTQVVVGLARRNQPPLELTPDPR